MMMHSYSKWAHKEGKIIWERSKKKKCKWWYNVKRSRTSRITRWMERWVNHLSGRCHQKLISWTSIGKHMTWRGAMWHLRLRGLSAESILRKNFTISLECRKWRRMGMEEKGSWLNQKSETKTSKGWETILITKIDGMGIKSLVYLSPKA